MNQLEREFLNWDTLHSSPASQVADFSFQMLTFWQDRDREVQILGAAVLFKKMCEAWGAEPSHILRVADNITCKNRHIDRFQAMDAYIANELK